MKKKTIFLIFVSLIIVAITAIVIFKDDGESKTIELNASVKYDDRKFIFTNTDTVDFVNADLSIDNYFKLRKINLQM